MVQDNTTLNTVRPVSTYGTSQAKLISDTFTSSLNEALNDPWHLYTSRKMY